MLMDDEDDRDRIYDPVIYDVMRDIANRVMGRYLAWQRSTSGAQADHWRDERLRVRMAIRDVNPDSRRAVEAMTARLRETLRTMPESAPALVS